MFKEAAKALRGETMVGLFADRQAEIWYSANLKSCACVCIILEESITPNKLV